MPSYSSDALKEKELFPDTGEPGEVYSAEMEYVVGTNTLKVTRRVRMDPDEPVLTVSYDVKNKSHNGSGDSSVHLNFFQYADFDDGANDYWDDIGYYDEGSTLVYTRDEAGDAYAGFASNKDPINHHVGEYPGYTAVNTDSLNNQNKFPASGSDDPVVGMEWDLNELELGETGSVTVQFGAAVNEENLKEQVPNPDPLQAGGVHASVTTLQFIPGKEENVTRGGHPLHSSLMKVFNDVGFQVGTYDLGVEPVIDSWLEADMRDDQLIDLEEALKKKPGKYVDEFGEDEAFNEYRLENGVEVFFETTDEGDVDPSTLEITFSESGTPEPADSSVSLKGHENSMTVTADHDVNNIPIDEWHGGSHRERSKRKPRWYEYDTDFEYDGVKGVRIVTISGGYAGFVKEWSERVGDNAASFANTVFDWGVPNYIAKLAMVAAPPGMQVLVDFLSVVPNTYSFVDFIVLADGRRYARIWDASQYPSLATYVDGERQALEQMPYNRDELFNLSLTAFLVQASAGVTPYHTPLDFYSRLLENEDLRERQLDNAIEDVIDLLPVSWAVHELYPRIPRLTLGYESRNGPEVDDPDGPFADVAGLLFPLSKKIDSS